MKLVYAIVNDDDTYAVTKAMQKKGIRATKLASTGGFLSRGNTTFMICCRDEQVDEIISVCKEHSRKRRQVVLSTEINEGMISDPEPVEVNIGGATIFVTDIERFEQV
ncbi:MAG: cyclic-di-AMP receptor [Ruminococcus sp.]|nr:cyclic-di-AMP receptor [Ruminococcus sp.]